MTKIIQKINLSTCGYCGHVISEKARLCPNCGLPITFKQEDFNSLKVFLFNRFGEKCKFICICGSVAYGFSQTISDCDIFVVVVDLPKQRIRLKYEKFDIFVYDYLYFINNNLKENKKSYGSAYCDSLICGKWLFVDKSEEGDKIINTISSLTLKIYLSRFLLYFSKQNKDKIFKAKELYHIYRVFGVCSYAFTGSREIQLKYYNKALEWKTDNHKKLNTDKMFTRFEIFLEKLNNLYNSKNSILNSEITIDMMNPSWIKDDKNEM